ncbi:MAG: DUF983 domain-containing protein [Saprospiraceae bacterium]|nr:DUF983 domain-containing protein [Bacteroidia bacterium]NNE14770.1 DUF983 domain-containing protein [Saprospiraceae bacterium]NNL93199.1 DUF983 domain-containing protein [Saprospiraceae bacterium]
MRFSLSAMWKNKCPRCRQGQMFVEPFKFSDPLAMNKNCSVCNQAMEPEPGFYYGAMFLSYIISTFTLLPLALLLVFYFKWSVEAAMGIVILFGALFFFKILRGSRSLWIHMMVRYDKSYS